jgi:acetate kinase
MNILVLNGGSSSFKATLRHLDTGPRNLAGPPPRPLWEAHAEWPESTGKASLRVRGAAEYTAAVEFRSPDEVLRPLLETLWSGPARVIGGAREVHAVGHRIVHGGKAFQETTLITPEVRQAIRQQSEFAPEHNCLELEAIEAAESVFGRDVPQIAVFDTQFHAGMPLAAKVYPAPFEWYERGIRRYGFHGISHQYVSRRAAEILGKPLAGLRVVTCHLGNGASLAAVRGGASADTTMGFTPLEGLMMGTRSGTVDPGILIYLVRDAGYGADQLDRLLNKESGLKGVSGISGDMRQIQAAVDAGNARAHLAFDVYIHRLCREIGAMVASLEGLDALVFTAGVGENCPPVREQACRRLAFLGIEIDAARNRQPAGDCDVAAADSRVRVLVVRTEEEWEITRECLHLLAG